MGKSFWIALVAVVVIMIGGFMAFGGGENSQQNAVEDPHEITNEDITLGPEDAPVTVVEYADFQCPACQAADPLVKEMLNEYDEEVRLVYRHFPLTQIHPQAYDAARASVAAYRQDSFWEMHDLLFVNQSDWSGDPNARSIFEGYAEDIGLDMEQYNQDFSDAGGRVDRDVNIAQQLNVSSTPTFYVNGEQIESPGTIEAWREVIDSHLESTEE